MRTAAWLLVVLLGVYLATGRVIQSGDNLPARYLPLSFWQGTPYLDQFPFLYSAQAPAYDPDDPDQVYYLRRVNEHYVSAYAELRSLLAMPVFAPLALLGVAPEGPWPGRAEKLTAALIVALSAALLYLTLRRLASAQMALGATLAYALGSSNLSVCSQGLWQHGPAELGLVAALYCLVRGRQEPAWVGRAGLPLALAVAARPLALVVVAPLFGYVVVHRRAQALRCLGFALPVVVLQLAYNAWLLASPADLPVGPVLKHWPSRRGGFPTPTLVGLGRVLFSPARGLFIYSPVFVLSGLGWLLSWRRGGEPLVRWAGAGCLVLLVVVGRWTGWWGGHTFGPRLLAEGLPLFALALTSLDPLVRRRWLQGIFAATLLWSMLAHSLGAFTEDTWNQDVDVNNQFDALWSWSDNQLANPIRRGVDALRLRLAGRPVNPRPDLAFDVTRYSVAYQGAVWPRRVESGDRLTLVARVHNLSSSVWLTGPGVGPGRIRLGWRWYRKARFEEKDRIPALEGRVNLGRNLFPGDVYGVRFTLAPPSLPGRYGLEVGLISEGVAWFSDEGASHPLQLVVEVTRAAGG